MGGLGGQRAADPQDEQGQHQVVSSPPSQASPSFPVCFSPHLLLPPPLPPPHCCCCCCCRVFCTVLFPALQPGRHAMRAPPSRVSFGSDRLARCCLYLKL